MVLATSCAVRFVPVRENATVSLVVGKVDDQGDEDVLLMLVAWAVRIVVSTTDIAASLLGVTVAVLLLPCWAPPWALVAFVVEDEDTVVVVVVVLLFEGVNVGTKGGAARASKLVVTAAAVLCRAALMLPPVPESVAAAPPPTPAAAEKVVVVVLALALMWGTST